MLFVEPSNLGINYCGDVINGKICRGFCIGVAGGDSKAAKICQHVDIIQIVSGRNDVVLGNAASARIPVLFPPPRGTVSR